LRLKLSSIGGLELAAPPKTQAEEIARFLDARMDWIARHANRFRLAQLPEWDPTSLWTPSSPRAQEIDDRSSVMGWYSWAASPDKGLRDRTSTFPELARQLRQLARHELDMALRSEFDQLARALLLAGDPPMLRTSWMATRWGSCHQAGRVTLNLAAAFLNPALRRHIVAHEISHLGVADHSRAFWEALECYDPDWKRHRTLLGSMAPALPWWVRVRPTLEFVLWDS
jgi:predicted metal-dependent hydrolase